MKGLAAFSFLNYKFNPTNNYVDWLWTNPLPFWYLLNFLWENFIAWCFGLSTLTPVSACCFPALPSCNRFTGSFISRVAPSYATFTKPRYHKSATCANMPFNKLLTVLTIICLAPTSFSGENADGCYLPRGRASFGNKLPPFANCFTNFFQSKDLPL